MIRSLGLAARAVAIALLAVSPFAAHIVLTDGAIDPHASDRLGGALLLAEGALVSALVAARLRGFWRALAIALLLGGCAYLALFDLRDGLLLSAGSPHAVIYTGLLVLFGLSLLPGREPIVTHLARTIHGELAPEVAAYTRRVTWAWCGFFAFQLLASALLLTFAPIAWWSSFVNILNLPLLAAMMLGERLTRPLWVAEPPHEYWRDMRRLPALLRRRAKSASVEA